MTVDRDPYSGRSLAAGLSEALERITALEQQANPLANRCGTCTHWNSCDMGNGYCELEKALKHESPMRSSDFGSILTRIDFGCLWWEAKS